MVKRKEKKKHSIFEKQNTCIKIACTCRFCTKITVAKIRETRLRTGIKYASPCVTATKARSKQRQELNCSCVLVQISMYERVSICIHIITYQINNKRGISKPGKYF